MSMEEMKKKIQEELQRRVQEENITSVEEMQRVLDEVVGGFNRMPREDFAGLSPEQVQSLQWYPFDSPGILRFHPERIAPAHTQVMRAFLEVASACGENGLKLTPRGYLPGKLVHAIFEMIAGEDAFQSNGRHRVHNEDEFAELMMVRHCAMWAGFLRKCQGKLLLTKKGRRLVSEEATGTIYFDLLRQACLKWNWGCMDLYPELPFIRTAFTISFRFLHRDGDVFRELGSHYGWRFVKAFPFVFRQFSFDPPEWDRCTPEEYVIRVYVLRTFMRFAIPFGLVDCDPPGATEWSVVNDRMIRVKRSALFEKLIEFRV